MAIMWFFFSGDKLTHFGLGETLIILAAQHPCWDVLFMVNVRRPPNVSGNIDE
jgi:hypothetical protein